MTWDTIIDPYGRVVLDPNYWGLQVVSRALGPTGHFLINHKPLQPLVE